MLAYTIVSIVVLVIMTLAFLFLIIRLFPIPFDRVKVFFDKLNKKIKKNINLKKQTSEKKANDNQTNNNQANDNQTGDSQVCENQAKENINDQKQIDETLTNEKDKTQNKIKQKGKSNNNKQSQQDDNSRFDYLQQNHRNRINYLVNFKKGKGIIFYILAFPLYLIGRLYSGNAIVESIVMSIYNTVELVVLKYNYSAIESLFNALPIYRVAVCILFVMIFLNAIVFALSIGHHLLWKWLANLKFRLTKNERVYLFGNCEQNLTIYKREKNKEEALKKEIKGSKKKTKIKKREIRILDDLSKADENELFLSNFLYKNIKFDSSCVDNIFNECGKRINGEIVEEPVFTIIINTGNAERNVYLTRLFVNKINDLDDNERKNYLNLLHIYVYSDPYHESIYEEFCKKSSGGITYFNKYKKIALDFISNYPFAKYMNEEEIDQENYVLKKEAEINVFLVGFGNTNQQIYKSSVANNQFLTTDENNYLVPKIVNYYIYDKSEVCDVKNLNHSFYRYEHEKVNYKQEDYLELPPLPYNEIMEEVNVNDPKFYSSIKKHASKKKAAVNFVIIAFGSDLENIDMAQKILDMAYDWGIEDIWVFVKVRDSHNYITFKSDHCVIIGNENETVFDVDRIKTSEYVKWGINQHALYLLMNTDVKNEDEALEKSRKAWFTTMLPILRSSNIYSILSLRSKLNLMGFDFKKKEEHPKNIGKIEKCQNPKYGFLELYNRKNDSDNNTNGKELYSIKPVNEMTIRDIFATLEHQRWMAFMISHGMVPSTKEEILQADNGKSYEKRKHSNITTMQGLLEYRKIVASKLPLLDKYKNFTKEQLDYEADVIRNDYASLDKVVDIFDKLGYEIINKKKRK